MNPMKNVLEGKSFPIHEILPRIKETVLAELFSGLTGPARCGEDDAHPPSAARRAPHRTGPDRDARTATDRGGLGGAVDGEDPQRGDGGTVGYAIRFDSRGSEKTRIEVVTEGSSPAAYSRIPVWTVWPWSSSTSSMSGASTPTSRLRSVSTSAAPSGKTSRF